MMLIYPILNIMQPPITGGRILQGGVFGKLGSSLQKMFKFLYEPWARIQSQTAAVMVLIGAIIIMFYPLQRLDPFIGIRTVIYLAISLSTSIFTIIQEYFQFKVIKNYIARGIMYLFFAASGLFIAPTHPGSLCLFFAGFTYLKAGLNGESGYEEDKDKGKK
jgi:hypothetical protein